MSKTPESKSWLTTSEVCKEFLIGRSTLLLKRRKGVLFARRFGREFIFSRQAIENYLAPTVERARRRVPTGVGGVILPKVPSVI